MRKDIPAWAQWIARDKDGACWVYEAEPHMHDKGWYENEVGRSQKVADCDFFKQLDWPLCLKKITDIK